MKRREFIRRSSLMTAALAAQQISFAQTATREKMRAAIIGHTGRGNYGHDLDVIFNGFDHISVVAVADPVEQGRAKAAQRSHAPRQYADFQELLRKENPQLVSIAPRWTDQHFAMAKAAMEFGAHILVEKPFTQTLTEADELLALASKQGRKIAVAHQMRLSPGVVQLRKEIGRGLIGDLVQVRSWGKQDKRAGGEDMIVLGTHLFDMIRLFVGDPISCVATAWHNGQPLAKQHAREAGENVGPVAGDEIEAQFIFPKQVTATFTSRGRLRDTLGPWAVELIGTKAIARILMDIDPRIYISNPIPWTDSDGKQQWERFDSPAEKGFSAANRRVVEDWLAAIADNREPECSGYNGMKALEMIMGIYESVLGKRPALFPLQERRHPLSS